MFFNLCWKNCEKPFVEGHDHFEWKGVSGVIKININFFVRNEVLNIFYVTIFSKKNNIFQNNSKKQFWRGMTIFQGMERQTTKMKINFSVGNGGSEYGFEIVIFMLLICIDYWYVLILVSIHIKRYRLSIDTIMMGKPIVIVISL